MIPLDDRTHRVHAPRMWRLPYCVLTLIGGLMLGCGSGSQQDDAEFMPPIAAQQVSFEALAESGPGDLRLDDLFGPEDYQGPPLLTPAPPKVLFEQDFEGETLPAPWTADGSALKLSRVEVPGGGHAMSVGGGSKVASGVPLSVWEFRPYASYSVEYAIRTEGFKGAGGQRIKSGTPLFQYLNWKGAVEGSGGLREKFFANPTELRTSTPREFRPTQDNRDTTGWQQNVVDITPPPNWSHGALMLAYAMPISGKVEDVKGNARGTVFVDNLRVVEHDRDYARAHQRPGGWERLLRIDRRIRGIEETRDALHAPSGSTWSKVLDLPDGARFAASVLADLDRQTAKRADTYRFSVVVDDDVAWSTDLNPLGKGGNSGWQDVDVDLSAFTGSHKIELRSEALGGSPASDRLVWSEPRIIADQAKPGRTFVFIVIDTLGAHRLGYEGGAEGVSPALDRVAASGTVFRDAISPSPWTLPSTASLLTGYLPSMSGVGTYRPGDLSTHNPKGFAPDLPTLAERLRDAGWQTEAALSNPFVNKRFGTDRGYRRFADFGSTPDKGQAAVGVQRVLDWLDRPTGGDRFFYLHLLDPHTPYGPPKSEMLRFREPNYEGRWADGINSGDLHKVIMGRDKPTEPERQHIINLHDAEILFTDKQIARIIDKLEHLDTEALLVVTSDHGEEFWEHDSMEHGHTLYPEVVRVPLIFWGHKVTQGQQIEEAVSTSRIAATIAELADVAIGQGPAPELSMAAAMQGRPQEAGLDQALTSGYLLYGMERMMIRQGTQKYIYNMRATRRRDGRAVAASSPSEHYQLDEDPFQASSSLGKSDPIELHRALTPTILESMKGRLVVLVDNKDEGRAVDIDVRIEAPGGLVRWAWDYLAPGPKGKQPDFKQDIDPVGGEARFTTSARSAMFAVAPLGPVDAARVTVSVNGVVLIDNLPFEQLKAPPVKAADPAGDSPRAFVFHTPGPGWPSEPAVLP